MKIATLFFIACTLLLSCYEDQEGCLDKLAKNYDVAADKVCESCCSYPELDLIISHKLGSTEMALNKEFKNDINSSFSIISQKCYLSNIAIEESGNKKVDFITNGKYLLLDGQQVEYIKDYVLVTGLAKSLLVNQFKSDQSIAKLNFTAGLDNKYNNLDVPKATSYFELDAISGMYNAATKNYASYIAKLAVGQGLKDTIDIEIKSDVSQVLSVSNVQSKFGADIEIGLQFQYDKLFSGVNFFAGKAIIEDKVTGNFSEFIR